MQPVWHHHVAASENIVDPARFFIASLGQGRRQAASTSLNRSSPAADFFLPERSRTFSDRRGFPHRAGSLIENRAKHIA
jgi:hypothetical protein